MLFRSREGDGMSFGLVRRASRDLMSSRSRLLQLEVVWGGGKIFVRPALLRLGWGLCCGLG